MKTFLLATLILISGNAFSSTGVSRTKLSAPATLSSATLLQAARDEIQNSIATGNTDTQCSDYVAKVLRRANVPTFGFRANDFSQVMPTLLPSWTPTDFTTADLATGRELLREFLNSFADETLFLAQWPREGQSGHVAIIEKVAADQYTIYQAQGGLSLPHSEPAKMTTMLYGSLPVQRSHIRLYTLPR
jgi:hypothetical protein